MPFSLAGTLHLRSSCQCQNRSRYFRVWKRLSSQTISQSQMNSPFKSLKRKLWILSHPFYTRTKDSGFTTKPNLFNIGFMLMVDVAFTQAATNPTGNHLGLKPHENIESGKRSFVSGNTRILKKFCAHVNTFPYISSFKHRYH